LSLKGDNRMKHLTALAYIAAVTLAVSCASSENRAVEMAEEIFNLEAAGAAAEGEAGEPPFVPRISVDLPEFMLPEESGAGARADREGTALVSSQNASLEVKPSLEHYKGGAVVYPWLPNRVYQIFTALDQLTAIQLEPGEELRSPPASGNTEAFEVQFTYSQENGRPRAQIYIMPFVPGKNTTLFINTSKRTYSFTLYSYQNTFMPLVSFTYPLQIQETLQRQIETRDTDIYISGRLVDMDFNYLIIPHSPHKPRWMPSLVFNDGVKTYIYFPSAGRASYAPVLFEVNSKDERVIVNYRVKGTYYIVDRVLSRAELVLDVNEGNIITIRRNAE
jgi:type IV secretion system protein VirB9